MVIAPYDVRYIHLRVINRRGKVVGRKSVGFQYHEVFYFRRVENYPAADKVLNGDLLSGGHRKPYGVRFSRGRAELRPLPPVPEDLSFLPGLFSSPPEFLGSDVASVRLVLVNETLGKPTVIGKPLRLPDDFPLPLKSEPLKGFDNLPLEFLLGARAVGILDSEQEISARLAEKSQLKMAVRAAPT